MDDPQMSMFGDGADRMSHQRQPDIAPNPDRVRRRLNGLLDKARNAAAMPWSERDVGMWEIVFPQMANWLPDDEANQLCFEFARELQRLRLAA
jgi:hypothetical protein